MELPTPLAGETILLVDDNLANLGILTHTLAEHDCRVLLAQHGKRAIQIARRALPALILLDVQLPGMDGFEVCRRLKADPVTRPIPILFMTEHSTPADKLCGFAAGGVDYITKPVEAAEVLARVSTHLRIGQLTRDLQAHNTALEQLVAERTAELVHANTVLQAQIAERLRTEKALRASEEQLRAYAQQLVAVQEAERAHIARDLHDEIGQMLTGLKLILAISTRGTPEEVQAQLVEAQMLVNDLTTRVRELSLDLRPAMLDDLGLLPTLLWHVKRYTAQTQIQVILKHSGLEQRVTPDVEIAVYRIVQEGLTNVARHAGVCEVRVWLWRTEDQIGVQIEDQGHGFTPEEVLAAHTSSGLAGMVERARLLGGLLTIEATPGLGTRLTAELPLAACRLPPLK
jgi:signal transduction histidine kinase